MKLNTILWSTRGRDWGFRMLLQPKIPCDDWLLPYEAMFNHTSTEDTKLSRGKVTIHGNHVPYVAVTFADPESRKDRAGRIIPHKIAIVGEESNKFQDFDSVQKDVWQKLSSVYAQLYEHESVAMEKIQLICNDGLIKISKKEHQQEAHTEEKQPNFQIAVVIMAAMTLAIVVVILLQIVSKKPEIPSPSSTVRETNQIVSKVRQQNLLEKSTKSSENNSSDSDKSLTLMEKELNPIMQSEFKAPITAN
ncbi:hypothetical protein [Nostoc sp. CCY0012]|uniref:hypothetical protein n=1 Tax=Nostoc sp. CCY0012 TaxID=1056123 RepID=UPI0039C651A7